MRYDWARPRGRETSTQGSQTYEKNFGERHLTTLLNATHLIDSISRLGRHNEAEEMASQIFSMTSDSLGSQHPRTTRFAQIIAGIDIEQGNWAEAEALYVRVLKAYEPYGEQHPYVIMAKANLAYALSLQRQFSEAEKLLQSALDSAKPTFDRGNGDFAILLDLAVSVKRAQAKYSDAEELGRQLLNVREDVLGGKHRDTLASMDYLALVLREERKYNDSERLYRQTLKGREEVLGKKHPDTLASTRNLAWVLQVQRKYSASEQLYRRLLREREEVLGKKRPDTLASMDDVAWMLRAQGKYGDAEELYRRTLWGR
jgi:tetratricopeptide (TPR) repeat protein